VKTPPRRTCLGCRRARPQAALVRLVRLTNGTVVVDAGSRAPGRGAYVCPDADCVARGLSRGRLGHAFRKPSEAGANLAAAVLAGSPPFEVNPAAIEDVDVITVRS
jgi:predicted RNA-binding protein YlxR (DUF448 family)